MIRAKGGQSAPQVELLQPSVLLFLLLDVFPDHLLVTSDRGYKVPSGPEVLSYEVPLLSAGWKSSCARGPLEGAPPRSCFPFVQPACGTPPPDAVEVVHTGSFSGTWE